VRVTYARTDDAGVVLRIEVMRGRSVSAMLMGFLPMAMSMPVGGIA
jgi:hypothetical protein